MKILMTGGTGFIGAFLCHRLVNNGHKVTVLSRKPERVKSICGKEVSAIQNFNQLVSSDEFDAIINLAGMPIADRRWTRARKKSLEDSRISITHELIVYLRSCDYKPEVIISGSAVGFYGDCGDEVINESSPFHREYTHDLCEHWEQEAMKAQAMGIRVCLLRTGLVIGPGGGFLQKMLWPFKLGLGGKLGSGKQWMSWVHRTDLVNLIVFLLDHKKSAGVYNATAPTPVTNEEFTQIFSNILMRPAFFAVPAFVLKLLLGEMSRLLLTGQRVLPKHAVDEGFHFQYPDLRSALNNVLT
ncbi:MAG: TIGR01777 family protein [Pseudomonadales bacterium]|nr:TIGR01777 family protein [Pseudomonadales bacterium]